MSIYDVYDHFHQHLGSHYAGWNGKGAAGLPVKGIPAFRTDPWNQARTQVSSVNTNGTQIINWIDTTMEMFYKDKVWRNLMGGATLLLANGLIVMRPTDSLNVSQFQPFCHGMTLVSQDPLEYLLDGQHAFDEANPFWLVNFHGKSLLRGSEGWALSYDLGSTVYCQPDSRRIFDIPSMQKIESDIKADAPNIDLYRKFFKISHVNPKVTPKLQKEIAAASKIFHDNVMALQQMESHEITRIQQRI